MSISAAEFEALQLQLIELKEAKYESQDREKKLVNENKTLKEHVSSLENDLKKAQAQADGGPKTFSLSGVMSKSKDKKEIEALQRNMELAIQEHKEQQDATMQNMKNLYTSNKALEEEIQAQKVAVQEKDQKIEAQESQLRKLQIQLLQYESSADINKSNERLDENHISVSNDHQTHQDATNESTGDEESLRLRENVRFLSTELKLLDEKLSKSEETYRPQIAALEQQLSLCKEKIKQDEIETAKMESRLEAQLTTTLKSKEELITKLSSMEDQIKKDKALAEQLDQLKLQVADLTQSLTSANNERAEYMARVKQVTMELEKVSQTKTTLDTRLQESQAEVQSLQAVRDEHAVVLGDIETLKNQIKNLEIALDRANTDCAELAQVKKQLDSVRLESANASEQITALQGELDALRQEAENLRLESNKVAPLENELDALKLAHLHAINESTTHKEQYEAERLKLIDVESSLQDMSTKLAEANEQVVALTAQANQLQTEKEDMATEYKIEERKSQRMIKELKSELQKERISMSRSVSMEQLSYIPASPLPVTTRRNSPPKSPMPQTPPPHAVRLSRQHVEAVSSLPLLSASVGNMELSTQTKEELLRRDLETSLTKFGKLAEEKWKLEEKARFLEENLALVNEDLVRKSKVIQYYVSKTKQTVSTDQLVERDKAKKQSGVRGALLRSGNDQELSLELLTKMEAVLEETVLKNIQHQNDLVTLGNENGVLQNGIRQLKEENKQLANESNHYKDQLMRLMSNHV